MSHVAGRNQINAVRIGSRRKVLALVLGLVAAALRLVAAALSAVLRRGPASRVVLVLEPFGMGDIISFEPMVRSLQEQGYDVRICAKPEWRVLYPQVPCWIAARLPWSGYGSSRKYRLAAYFSRDFRECLGRLRQAARGSTGVDTRGDMRSVILLYLAGCRRVVTLSNYVGYDLRNLSAAAEQVEFSPGLRRWEVNLLFLPKLGARLDSHTAPPAFLRWETLWLRSHERRLGLVAVAPWRGKMWGAKKWAEFASIASAAGWALTGLCGPGQSAVAREELGPSVPLVECLSVEDWVRQLQRFAAIVTLDSGPMHLADALGVPLVALFGGGPLPLWAPSGTRCRVLSPQADPDFFVCHPVDSCTEAGRRFMSRIDAREVLAAVEGIQPAG